MPEIPELEVYARRTVERFGGAEVTGYQLASPFLLRSVEVPLDALVGRALDRAERLGKQLAFRFTGSGEPIWLVVHLMLAGRLDERAAGKPLPRRDGCFRLDFASGRALALLERSRRKQAALVVVRDPREAPRVEEAAVDPLSADFTVAHLARVLEGRNRQLKNALTDWRAVGLGNAYADEVLRAAGLSPLLLTERMSDAQVAGLHAAIRAELVRWVERVDDVSAGKFPADQRGWRREMVVHGKHGEPCAVCGDTVERISYAERETCYCPTCQTGGKVLADRRRSRFLK